MIQVLLLILWYVSCRRSRTVGNREQALGERAIRHTSIENENTFPKKENW